MTQIVLLGGGGHCKSVLDSILNSKQYSVYGIVDNNKTKGENLFGVPFLGGDEMLPELLSLGIINIVITVGSVGNTEVRKNLYYMCKDMGFDFPAIIDKNASVSDNAIVEQGVFIGKNAVINAGAIVNEMSIINTCAIIEHDCLIGEFCHISPGATLCGNVKVGHNSHIGANSTVIQGISITENCLIGAGSVVIKDISSSGMYAGNPVKFIK